MAPPPHHPPPHPHHPPPHHPHHHHALGLEKDEGEGEGEEVYSYDDPLISNMCCREGYGELTRQAVEKMAATVGMSEEQPTGHFFDLGSGAGKIPMHMLLRGYASAATGVEISVNRHSAAVHLAQEYLVGEGDSEALEVLTGKAEGGSGLGVTSNGNNGNGDKGMHKGRKQLHLLEGDMLEADLADATVIYMNHACFPEDIVAALVDRLLSPTAAPQLEVVLTTPRLPALVESGLFVADPGYLNLEMEMYDGYGTLLTVYRRVGTAAGGTTLAASA